MRCCVFFFVLFYVMGGTSSKLTFFFSVFGIDVWSRKEVFVEKAPPFFSFVCVCLWRLDQKCVCVRRATTRRGGRGGRCVCVFLVALTSEQGNERTYIHYIHLFTYMHI